MLPARGAAGRARPRARRRALPRPPGRAGAAHALGRRAAAWSSCWTTCSGATRASLELVAHLLRRPPRGPLLLALAYRRRPAAGAAWRRHSRPRGATAAWSSCALGAAGRAEEARELLGDAVADAGELDLPRKRRQPVLPASSSPTSPRRAGRRPALPGGVPPRAALEQEIAGLGPAARSLLHGRRRGGRPADLELAAATAGVPEADALGRRRRAAAPRPAAARRRPAPLPLPPPDRAPRGVRRGAGEAWRLEAHGRAAAALAARGAPLAARAHHLERCAAVRRRRGGRRAHAGRARCARARAGQRRRLVRGGAAPARRRRRRRRAGSGCSSRWRRRWPRRGGWSGRWRRWKRRSG